MLQAKTRSRRYTEWGPVRHFGIDAKLAAYWEKPVT
jgi:hypothetical protein